MTNECDAPPLAHFIFSLWVRWVQLWECAAHVFRKSFVHGCKTADFRTSAYICAIEEPSDSSTQLPPLVAIYSNNSLPSHSSENAWCTDSGLRPRLSLAKQTYFFQTAISLNSRLLFTWRCLTTHLPNEPCYFGRDEFSVVSANAPHKEKPRSGVN
jgi:hypothetical protein